MGDTDTGALVRRDEGNHGLAQTDTMGGEIERGAELGTAQLEASARALIQARFYLAKQPNMMRLWDQVEQRLRKECQRPGFANAAWWVLPLGNDPAKYPQGLSIRYAEAALRLSGNIDIQVSVTYDDAWKRIVRVTVLDLETNFAYTTEAAIDKTVERRSPGDRRVLSMRENSQQKLIYTVEATEQEVALKQGSVVSKAIRTQGLRLIPGDILDECKALILSTRKKGAEAEDPESARKSILDNFADLSVMPADLAKYLEHDTNAFQPAERDLLRGIYVAIKNGMATWKDVMEAKFGVADGAQESEGAKKLKDLLAKRQTAAPAAATATVNQPQTAQPAAQEPAGTQTATQPTAAPQAATGAQESDTNELPDIEVIRAAEAVEASGKPRPTLEQMRQQMAAGKSKPRQHRNPDALG